MYNLYSKPPLRPRVESVHRHIVRGVAYFSPDLIAFDSRDLTGMRSSDVGLILKSKLSPILKGQVALKCNCVRGGTGREDAKATLLENVPIEFRSQIIPRARTKIIRGAVLRRATLDATPRDDASVDLAFDLLQASPKLSLAEATCFQRLALETGGRSSKHLLQCVEAINSQLGSVREIVEQGVSDKVFL